MAVCVKGFHLSFYSERLTYNYKPFVMLCRVQFQFYQTYPNRAVLLWNEYDRYERCYVRWSQFSESVPKVFPCRWAVCVSVMLKRNSTTRNCNWMNFVRVPCVLQPPFNFSIHYVKKIPGITKTKENKKKKWYFIRKSGLYTNECFCCYVVGREH